MAGGAGAGAGPSGELSVGSGGLAGCCAACFASAIDLNCWSRPPPKSSGMFCSWSSDCRGRWKGHVHRLVSDMDKQG